MRISDWSSDVCSSDLTLLQLAQRFYDPAEGRICLNGIDLRRADPADVRAYMAVVPQETVIFAVSARDTLSYGRWDATDDQIWAPARGVNAEAFLQTLPEKLATLIEIGQLTSRVRNIQY